MNWRKLKQPLGAVLIVLLTAVVTPLIEARMKGAPLNGVRDLVASWARLLQLPIPAWLTILMTLGAFGACFIWFRMYKAKARRKVDLSIVVLSTPPPRWHIGAMAQTPVMTVSFRAQLAHTGKHSLKIVKGYLEGTECSIFYSDLVVAGPYDESVMVHFGVRPVIAKDGEAITRRIVLVDQFGSTHRTKRIRIEPGHHSASQFSSSGNPIQCWFCKGTIALEELAETSAVPAHKSCIK